MIMLTSYMAHWQSICQWRQAITDHDNLPKNACHVPHIYSVGDLVLICQDSHGKLARPTHGPYQLIDVARKHVNGTVMVDLNHSHKAFNIRWLIPFKPHQNHWGCDLSYHMMPHNIIFLLVIMIHTSRLSSCMPILKKSINFLHQHMSPFAMLPSVHFYKEGLFPHNTTNLDVAPHYQFATSSLSQHRNNHIYFSSYSFQSTSTSTSLFNSICHMALSLTS
jgi:hypothetical protein